MMHTHIAHAHMHAIKMHVQQCYAHACIIHTLQDSAHACKSTLKYTHSVVHHVCTVVLCTRVYKCD